MAMGNYGQSLRRKTHELVTRSNNWVAGKWRVFATAIVGSHTAHDDRRQEMLVRQIHYTAVLRPALRGAAFAVLLLPALYRGLDSQADQLLVAGLGLLSALTLVYSASVFFLTSASEKDVGISAPRFIAAAAIFAVIGGLAAAVALSGAGWSLWVSSFALCLAAVLALSGAVSVPRGWRVHDPTARTLANGSKKDTDAPDEKCDDNRDRYEGTAIACSGGGIRAAAFCLGGLQRLRWKNAGETKSFYDETKRVFAVSGGAYVATALHLARRHTSDPEARKELFAPGSEEEEWLRRRSKFLLPSGARVAAALSLLYGIACTLALIVIATYLFAWYVGWLLTRVGGVCGVSTGAVTPAECLITAGPADFQPSAWWKLLMVGLLISGLVLFAAMKTVSKYWPRGGVPAPATTRVLVGTGVVAAAIGLLVPWLIVHLSNATLDNQPTETVAEALAAAQLATPAACKAAIQTSMSTQARIARISVADTTEEISFSYGACGETWTDDARVFAPLGSAFPSLDCPAAHEASIGSRPVPSYCADQASGGLPLWQSVPAWMAVVSAAAAAIRALAKGLSAGTAGTAGSEKKAKPSRFANLAESVRQTVLPWTAVVVLGFVLAIVLINLTRDNLVHPDRLNSIPGPLWAAVVFLAVRFLSDAILSSLHPYYRERLSGTFLIRRDQGLAEPLDYTEPTHLWVKSRHADEILPKERSTHEPTDAMPQLTICCAVNISDPAYVPAARGCASFLFHTGQFVPPAKEGGPDQIGPYTKEVSVVMSKFSAGAIGISDARVPPGRMQPAEDYSATSDPQGFDTTLAAAMATSGAAFSPLVGRKSGKVRPYRVLLALVNARLGVWLPNPYTVVGDAKVANNGPAGSVGTWMKWAGKRALRPGPFRLFKEAFGALSIFDGRLYVTDGGHYDNTGMVEALRDRPERLVVLDASADPRDSLDALGDAIVTARMDLGLVIKPVNKDDLGNVRGTFDKDGKYAAPSRGWMHLTAARVGKPEEVLTHIWFVKNVLTGDPDLELGTYAAEHPSFPSTSTSNQFYGEYDFEAYRLLGFTNTTAMMDAMKLFEQERALLRSRTARRPAEESPPALTPDDTAGHVPPV